MAEINQNSVKNQQINFQQLYDQLQAKRKEIYSNLDQVLTLDTNNLSVNNIDTVIILYEKCLGLIEKALIFYDLNISAFDHNDNKFKISASDLVTQLKGLQNQTSERLSVLKTERVNAINNRINSSFLNAASEVLDDNYLIIDDDEDLVRSNLRRSSSTTSANSLNNGLLANFKKADEVIRIDNGVQLFYIADDGTVSTPSYPTTLSVYTFDKNELKDSNVFGFVRVDDWVYPLVPNESPAMKTNFNAYIFPNENSQNIASQPPNATFVGITFSNQINDQDKFLFEDVLANYGALIYQDRNESSGVKRPLLPTPLNNNAAISGSASMNNLPNATVQDKDLGIDQEQKSASQTQLNTAGKIASSIITGAEYLSRGIGTTSEYASKYIQTGGEKLKSQVKPNTEPAKIDPKYQKVAQNVRYGTHVSVRVSSYLLNKLGSLASSAAKTVAPHIRQGSTALLSKTGIASDKGSASNYVDNVCTVASSSLEGFSVVYDSLEKAAKNLAKNCADQTVTVMEHKYGPDAAKLTENTMLSVGNVAVTVNNVQHLKIVRTLAKETAKETIKCGSKSSKNINNDATENKSDFETKPKQ